MSARWRLRRTVLPGQEPWKHLQAASGLSQAAARVAWMRGEDSAEDLAWRLDPSWNRTFDPFFLSGMESALRRIRKAISTGERVLVYGDYDADGVTATALLVRVLEKLGCKAEFFIPNRFNDGYGLHMDCIRELHGAGGPGLFISVDCGIRSLAEVSASREMGVDWIITDHHALGAELPEAAACLHPELGESPNRALAGVGVAFKLAQGLLDAYPVPGNADIPFLDGLLKLVALGSIADMVPLRGENALLVKRGMMAMARANGPGLQELLRLSRIEGMPKAQDIAFGVSPRLNAVGRMGGAEDAVRLLLTRDAHEAKRLAEKVDALNTARKEVQEALFLALPEPDGQAFDLVVGEKAHKGVLGIVAARRMRSTGRPTGVGTVMDGVVHCSLRAPEGFDLTELMEKARPFLLGGGGHRLAAGISFELSRLPFVRSTLISGAKAQGADLEAQPISLDGRGTEPLPAPEDLMVLEPFGSGFPEPLYLLDGQIQDIRPFGNGHSRLRLTGIPESLTWFFSAGEVSAMAGGERLLLAASIQDQPKWGRSWKVDSLLGHSREGRE